ncbi:DUF1345 domain-containing protein [Paracoccus yeei]|jgi:uncharacterized membrane protein|uniref:DUF1345 domain-containing protein n=2 Tax=Paracoccus TaxID=265 RepID=A0A1V0GNN8_9RHOB|nr:MULTISPECIES: DUF1345 domain-containing protein [Paracoccus]ARC35430.1 DUF1345 domain-containing protein [Paracoccus yeei]ATQ56585.1 DUF1345 domain-containing protein [Paracoccus yeei]AWX92260.1 DUF1345 domain-containing protein [Paracoccus mutanolyticus]
MIGDLRRHLRFLMAFGLGLVAGMLAFRMAWLDRLLIFADVFCLAYLVLVALMMRRMTVRDLHRHADDDDEGMRLIVPLAVGVVVLSLFAIHMTLRDPSGGFSLRPALAILSVPLGWAMIHTVMAFHYASLWHAPAPGGGLARGLDFPGQGKGELAGIWDFIYYSFTLGMTAQTSDVAVTSTALRRVTIVHSGLSFFYNAVLVALTVNAAVSLGQ